LNHYHPYMKHLFFVAVIAYFPLTLLSQVSNIKDSFEGDGNITSWVADSSALDTAFSNPYSEEINTSSTVLKYEDTGGVYANIRFQTNENFDLSKNSSFSLKIYVPSNSISGTQQNQISLKLQDGTIDDPWTTQAEIIKEIVLDTWQKVTFNFATDAYRNQDQNSANPTTRSDFNIVLLQLNSEENTDSVTGYIDDFFYSAEQKNQNTVVFTESNLPIIIIETENSASIPDEPKILGTMKIIKRPNGDRNYVTDANNEEFLDYSGTIGIETRGSSSQTLPKKPYAIDTLEEDGIEDNSVKLLGMSKENDWILNSFAFDDSMMRDYISYEMTRKMGQYAVNLRYCEVVLNGEYMGLYALSEKIKRDGDRVDIAKLDDDEDSFPKVTGGYLIQSDRPSDDDPNAWYNNGVGYIHEKPNSDDITAAQSSYIETVFRALDNNAMNADITKGYPAIIDVPSFVDYMLIAEVASNVDAYALSTYYHKDRGGKLRAGPVWDYNLTFGNDLFDTFSEYYDRSHTDVWQFEYSNVGANFWGDLFNNSTFKCYLSKRFHEVTNTGAPLNYEVISDLIDTTVVLISEAVMRENEKWNTIEDFSGEITAMKSWIQERMEWMTDNLGSFSDCNAVTLPSLVFTKINYNPQETTTFPESDASEFLEIQNTGNTSINLTGVHLSKLGVAYQFPKDATLMAGQSLILASNSAVFKERYGIDAFDNFSRYLPNSSQNLTLSDAFGNVIDQVTYTDEAPWPGIADGDGSYLELTDVNSDNALASNWITNSNESLSVRDFKTSAIDFEVYPNPAKENVRVNAKQTIQEILIFNPLGQEIKNVNLNINLKSAEINISRLNNGIYYLKLRLLNAATISTIIIKK
jgi:hypothetical protein